MKNLSEILLSPATTLDNFYDLLEEVKDDELINCIDNFLTSEEGYKEKLLSIASLPEEKLTLLSKFFKKIPQYNDLMAIVTAKNFIPAMIRTLLEEGIIKNDQLNDLEYLRKIILDNKHLADEIEYSCELETDFIISAREALKKGNFSVFIVLISTAIEHKLNFFFLNSLAMELSQDEIKEVLRNSVHTKTGWLFALVTGNPMPEKLKERIRQLFSVRNFIVHYKYSPNSEEMNLIRNQEYLKNVMELPSEISVYLNDMLHAVMPEERILKELAEQILRQ